MSFKSLSNLSYLAFFTWLIWQLAFMKGYQDAVGDLAKKGYNFEQTRKAFR